MPLDFFADGDLSFIEQPSKIDSTIPLSGAVSLSIFVWNSNPGCLQMTPTHAACAISLSTLVMPPRVGSRKVESPIRRRRAYGH